MALFRKILSLSKRARMEREIDADLREHMAMCVDDDMAQGMSREEAERDARRRFGSPTAMRERVAEEDAALGLESLLHDVRGALRVFRRSPGFSIVVVATLALSIGANTSIFEILNAVRLRTLPITKPGELVELRIADGNPTRLGAKTMHLPTSPCPCGRRSKGITTRCPASLPGPQAAPSWGPPASPPGEWPRGRDV
jgi:hypothetical protein